MQKFTSKQREELGEFIQATGSRRVATVPASMLGRGTGLTGTVYIVAEGREMTLEEVASHELVVFVSTKWRKGRPSSTLYLLTPGKREPSWINVKPVVGPRASWQQTQRPGWLGAARRVRAWATLSPLAAIAAVEPEENDNNNPVGV